MGSRITRREIKRDELVDTLGGLKTSVEQHARSVVIGVGALVVLGAAIAGGIWYSRSREADAQLKLSAALRALNAPVTEDGGVAGQAAAAYATRRQKYDEVARLAGVVLTEHPSSTASKWASYYKAFAQKELGDYPGALQTVGALALDQEEFLASSAKFLQGQIHEAQGDTAGALEIYTSLAASAPQRFPVDMALMSQARILEAQGKSEEARDVYRRVIQEFPDSPFAREASQKANPANG